MIQEKVRILDHKQLTPSYFKLTLASPYISSHAQPGQFVNVKVSEDCDPLLPRPLSIHRADPAKQIFELLYEVVGRGTEELSKFEIGRELQILGPLGSGFNVKKEIAILAAGGIGVAPLCFLAEEVIKKAKAVYVFIGAKTADSVLCEKHIRDLGVQVAVATEDGTAGKKGLITDILNEFLSSQLSSELYTLCSLFSCGPQAMLKEVASLAQQKKIECQVSLEAHMACGVGACLGCAIETGSGYKMVCKDGPVFPAEEIKW